MNSVSSSEGSALVSSIARISIKRLSATMFLFLLGCAPISELPELATLSTEAGIDVQCGNPEGENQIGDWLNGTESLTIPQLLTSIEGCRLEIKDRRVSLSFFGKEYPALVSAGIRECRSQTVIWQSAKCDSSQQTFGSLNLSILSSRGNILCAAKETLKRDLEQRFSMRRVTPDQGQSVTYAPFPNAVDVTTHPPQLPLATRYYSSEMQVEFSPGLDSAEQCLRTVWIRHQ